jgi:dTMP kinase
MEGNPCQGKFIVLEGTDGSGKATQLARLAGAFRKGGLPVETVDFPQYEKTFFGRMVGRYLAGRFGKKLSPYLASLFYAGDRWQAAGQIRRWLADGETVLANRYKGSNDAHQAARLPEGKRTRFLAWLDRLEFGIFRIPREDLTILLYVPPEIGQRLVDGKKERKWLGGAKRDLHERDKEHLRKAAEMYLRLAAVRDHWITIDCTDGEGGIRSIESIHRDILEVLKSRLEIGI